MTEKITAAEIEVKLALHLKWLKEEKGGSRANFSRANFSRADLSGAALARAALSKANLSGADLSGADLSGANLSGADLSGADLSGADLSGANFSDANLSDANLSDANLSWANLSDANLSDANLDFSVWPLWCGTKGVKVSLKFIFQLLAHVAALECTDNSKEYAKIKALIMPFVKQSHRAKDLGLLTETG